MVRIGKGMRKGISLVEMLTAIILFGLISVISYNYYKLYYDTSFAAKQTRVYAIIDQGNQLVNAYDLYSSKMGSSPTIIQDMIDQKILSEVPTLQRELTATGWDLNKSMDLNDTVLGGIGFTYSIDASVVSSANDRTDYCNILNNAMSNADLNTTTADLNTTTAQYAVYDLNATAFCIRNAADANSSLFVFIKAR